MTIKRELGGEEKKRKLTMVWTYRIAQLHTLARSTRSLNTPFELFGTSQATWTCGTVKRLFAGHICSVY